MQSCADWNCDDTNVSNTTSDRRLHVDLIFVCGFDLCVSAKIQWLELDDFLNKTAFQKLKNNVKHWRVQFRYTVRSEQVRLMLILWPAWFILQKKA
jgi:hypothetical protein